MGIAGQSKYPALVEQFSKERAENPALTIAVFTTANKLPYYEFCRQWALSEHYQPIFALDRRFVAEGERAVDNLMLPKADIRFLKVVKCIGSPIRLAILRHLCQGPSTIKTFILESQFAYTSAMHAIKHLETQGLVHVGGIKDAFNLYELSNVDATIDLLAAIDKLSA